MNKYFAWFGLPGSLVLTSIISLLSLTLAFIDPTLTRLTCVVAMFLSSLGDILLMDYKPITSGLPFRGFIPGAIVFSVSHIVYACAFTWLIFDGGFPYFNAGAFVGIALFVVLCIWLYISCRRRHGDRKMLYLCILYLFFITINLTTVFSSAVSLGGIRWLSALGILSFLISDLFIAIERVCHISLKYREELIWTFYPIGQILLLIGA